MDHRESTEKQYYNSIVHKEWDKKSLYVDKENPPFGLKFFDLFDVAKEYLGELKEKKILEIGCGSGEIAVFLAKNNSQVYAIDISDESINIAKKRAAENKVEASTHFLVCSGHKTPFTDNFFDIVFINVSLHHLDLSQALKEIRRVLKTSGHFVAIEPFAFSSFLQKIRASKLVTKIYPIIQETPTERILNPGDLKLLKKYFPSLKFKPRQTIFHTLLFRLDPLFSILAKIFIKNEKDEEKRRKKMNIKLKNFDKKILKLFPFLKITSRFIIFKAQK